MRRFRLGRFHTVILLTMLGLLGWQVGNGCLRGSPPMHAVTGTVTIGGQPATQGTIVFANLSRPTRIDVGFVENGRFEFKASAGVKQVYVFADAPDGARRDSLGARASWSLVADRYQNEASPLRAEVKSDGENRFTFEVSPLP